MKAKIEVYRQGDVVLFRRRGKKEEKQKHNGKITVALGEVSGHSHVIVGEGVDAADWWKNANGTQTVNLKNPAKIKHQEHKEILLPAGEYEIVIQREYSPQEIRKVLD